MTAYDQSYKQLFTFPRMIEDFLRGFVPGEWLKQLDFSTLERVNASFVSDEYQQREGDMIWRIKSTSDDTWLYIYLLIEFQSTVYHHMAVRMMTYVGLLYQNLIHSQVVDKDGMLPPVLPIVLYNGQRRWSASCELSQLILEAPPAIKVYQAEMRYLLIDEGRLRESDLALERNLAVALFKLERSRTPKDLENAIALLIEWLGDTHAQTKALRRAFSTWIRRVILPHRFPGIAFGAVEELQEVKDMLAERVKEWTKEWKQQGLQQGSLQSTRDDILDVLLTRFDSAPQDIMDVLQTIEDISYLKSLHRQAVKIKSIEDFQQFLKNSEV